MAAVLPAAVASAVEPPIVELVVKARQNRHRGGVGVDPVDAVGKLCRHWKHFQILCQQLDSTPVAVRQRLVMQVRKATLLLNRYTRRNHNPPPSSPSEPPSASLQLCCQRLEHLFCGLSWQRVQHFFAA